MASDLSLQSRFGALDELLTRHQSLWGPSPFQEASPAWVAQAPEMMQWLEGLEEGALAHFEADPTELRRALSSFLPALGELEATLRFPRVVPRALELERHFHHGIPGRKWSQIEAFLTPLESAASPALEWCAGKGYLGRALAARDGRPVRGLEWRQGLCESGEREARQKGVHVRLIHQDVLAPGAERHVEADQQVLALHACGDLHRRLLQVASRTRPQTLLLSPCCYQRIESDVYQPLSSPARDSALTLHREHLHLAVQETVTGGRRVRRMRDQEAAWRLGFDALQREIRGADAYLPVPSMPKCLLGERFRDFCEWAAGQRRVPLPQQLAWDQWEERGWTRLEQVRRLQLVPHAFRRALETWLVLDQALFMQESGYRVEVSEFCERQLTPRNLLIDARRVDAGTSSLIGG